MQRNRKNLPVYRITANVNRTSAAALIERLLRAGVHNLHVRAGRHSVLQEIQGPFGIVQTTALGGEPGETISFVVTQKNVRDAMQLVVEQNDLKSPGHGSVFAEDFSLVTAHANCRPAAPKFAATQKTHFHTNLSSLNCIVQRGHADNLARTALESGSAVPAIHYVHGTGIRDRMGLLRITIPAEKELLMMPVSRHDVQLLWDILMAVGKFDQPARGFLYESQISYGLADLKVTRGTQRHLASIDQLIAAIDHLQGDSTWRKRTGLRNIHHAALQGDSDLTEIFVMVNEGAADALVAEALRHGGGGATISRWRHASAETYAPGRLPPARESVTIVAAKKTAPEIIAALQDHCSVHAEIMAQLMYRPVVRAYTYVHRP